MKFKPFLIIVFVFSFYCFAHFAKPLFAPDETRYMEVAREMVETDNYIAPHLAGIRYFEKPAMGYWFIAGCQLLFGENKIAARFPAIFATLLTALLVYLFARNHLSLKRTALFAPIVYLFFPFVFCLSSVCSLDAVFSLFLTLTIFTYYRAITYQDQKQRKNILHGIALLILCGISAGAAFLIKGFLAFAVPVLAVLPWLIAEKQWKKILITPWIPLVVALLVIAPWAWLVHLQEPDYWRYFVVEEHLRRFLGGAEAQHPKSAFYFLPVLLWGTAVWLPFLPAMFVGWKKIIWKKDSDAKFLLSWFIFPFLFFSSSSGKLVPYILPCMVPISLLFTFGLHHYFSSCRKQAVPGKNPRYRLFTIPIMSLMIALLPATAVSLWLFADALPHLNEHTPVLSLFLTKFEPFSIFNVNEQWKFWLISVVAIWIFCAFLAVVLEKKLLSKMFYFLIGISSVFFVAYIVVPEHVYECRCPLSFIQKHQKEIDDNTVLMTHGNSLIHAVCYQLRRTDVFTVGEGELAYGLKYEESKERLIPYSEIKSQIQACRKEGKKVAFFYPTDRYLELLQKKQLEKPDEYYGTGSDDGVSLLIYLPIVSAQ